MCSAAFQHEFAMNFSRPCCNGMAAREWNEVFSGTLWSDNKEGYSMRSALLWMVGIPIPIILLLWLVTGHA